MQHRHAAFLILGLAASADATSLARHLFAPAAPTAPNTTAPTASPSAAPTEGDDNPNCKPDLIKDHAGYDDMCAFATDECDGVGAGLFGSYAILFYCGLGGSGVALVFVALPLLVILLSGLGSTADVYFIPQLQYLSDKLKLSPDVAGVTLLALGNGAPDVFTAIAVARTVDFPLLLSDLLGGSVFIATVVLGAVSLVARKRAGGTTVVVESFPFWRDMLFYLLALVAILIVAADGNINLGESLCFLALYVVYIGIVLGLPRLRPVAKLRRRSSVTAESMQADLLRINRQDSGLTRSRNGFPDDPFCNSEPSDGKVVEGGDDDDDGLLPGIDYERAPDGSSSAKRALWAFLYVVELPLSFCRYLSIPGGDGVWDARRRFWTVASPPLAAFIFLVECVGGGVPDAVDATAGAAPTWAIAVGLGFVGLAALHFITPKSDDKPSWYPVLMLLGFIMTVVWLDLLANEVVAIIETIGRVSGISTSILGLTVIAIGNSIGDFVADTAAARGADVRMAVAACFGSPLLMNILGVGISLTLYTSLNNESIPSPISRQCRVAYIFLFIALLSSCAVFPLNKYCLPRWFSFYLFGLYATFLLISVLVESEAIPRSALCSWLPYGDAGKCQDDS